MSADTLPLNDLREFFQPYAEQFKTLGHVLIAIVLGGLVGFERELRDRPAGLRTHMLVSAAGCLLISLGDPMIEFFADLKNEGDLLRVDPTRLIEALITGVAFLGAGTIIRPQGGGVKGLTTAASILVAAVIGVAVAIGQFVVATGTSILTVLFLHGLHSVSEKISGKR